MDYSKELDEAITRLALCLTKANIEAREKRLRLQKEENARTVEKIHKYIQFKGYEK